MTSDLSGSLSAISNESSNEGLINRNSKLLLTFCAPRNLFPNNTEITICVEIMAGAANVTLNQIGY